MNNWTSPRPSMIDLGKKSKVALLAGCGGGGDIMNTIPVMNLLKKLGVEKFVLADIGCKWWEFNGEMALGGEVIDLDWLQPSERLSENVAIISKETKVVGGHGKGEYLHESLMKKHCSALFHRFALRSDLRLFPRRAPRRHRLCLGHHGL